MAPEASGGAAAGPPIDLDLPRLVADHADVLYRYAYRLTGSTSDAEDLTQQTFLIAHQKLSQVRNAQSARGWLFAVLRHAFLKSERQTQRLPLSSAGLDIESIPDEIIESLSVDRELLQTAIDELAEPYRLVLLSFYFEELSYREIAERFDLPVGTVMSRLSRPKTNCDRDCSNRSAQRPPASRRGSRREAIDGSIQSANRSGLLPAKQQ